MAADRVAGERSRTGSLLALHTARRHLARMYGRPGQVALADRTRLSRTQTGGRPRSLRRPRLAWFPSSRNSLCRSLRIPDLREGDDSPLRTFPHLARHAISHSHWLSTQRFCRCVRNATCRTQSQHCVSASRGLWRTHCLDVLVADRCVSGPSSRMSDAVGLMLNVLTDRGWAEVSFRLGRVSDLICSRLRRVSCQRVRHVARTLPGERPTRS